MSVSVIREGYAGGWRTAPPPSWSGPCDSADPGQPGRGPFRLAVNLSVGRARLSSIRRWGASRAAECSNRSAGLAAGSRHFGTEGGGRVVEGPTALPRAPVVGFRRPWRSDACRRRLSRARSSHTDTCPLPPATRCVPVHPAPLAADGSIGSPRATRYTARPSRLAGATTAGVALYSATNLFDEEEATAAAETLDGVSEPTTPELTLVKSTTSWPGAAGSLRPSPPSRHTPRRAERSRRHRSPPNCPRHPTG